MSTHDKMITMRGLLLTALEQMCMLDSAGDANRKNLEEYNRRIEEIGRMASTLFGEEFWNMPGTVGLPTLSLRKLEKLIHLIEELEFDDEAIAQICES